MLHTFSNVYLCKMQMNFANTVHKAHSIKIKSYFCSSETEPKTMVTVCLLYDYLGLNVLGGRW